MHEKPCLIPILIHSIVFNDTQADLGLCCLHMLEEGLVYLYCDKEWVIMKGSVQ